MMRSVWMHPWDLEGVPPAAVLDRLERHGLNACHLAVVYHSGRMIAPGHATRRVVEHPSAAYLPVTGAGALKPLLAGEPLAIERFLSAAAARRVPVHAWLVLTHNDHLGAEHPDCCITNVFGDRYSYALCPANPAVAAYCAALCSSIAGYEFAGVQLEALSFMGYAHQGLHEKRGARLSPAAEWLLSICACRYCREGYGAAAESVVLAARMAIDHWLNEDAEPSPEGLEPAVLAVLGQEGLEAILAHRRKVILGLLDRIRASFAGRRVSLRVASSRLFAGGKSGLELHDVAGRADSACFTFFGTTEDQMRAELAAFLADVLPLEGGFMFHHPDCHSPQDVERRIYLLSAYGVRDCIFYCYGMAAEPHWRWLAAALKKEVTA